MACGLWSLKKEIATHYVSKDGIEYSKDEYANHGYNEIKKGYKDLPPEGYPYTIRYRISPEFKCCEICDCSNKI